MLISFIVVYIAAIDFLPMLGVHMRPLGFVPVLAFIASLSRVGCRPANRRFAIVRRDPAVEEAHVEIVKYCWNFGLDSA